MDGGIALPTVEVEAPVDDSGIGFGGIGTGLEPWSIFGGGAVGWGFVRAMTAREANEFNRMVAAERAASKKAAPQSAGADAGYATSGGEQLGASSMADVGDAGDPSGFVSRAASYGNSYDWFNPNSAALAATGANNTANIGIITVTLPDGSTYFPLTAVKNEKQATKFGLPIGTPIPIAVPWDVNPQGLVNEWGSGSIFNGLGEFALFWMPRFGSHDYKNQYGEYGPMFDAFGNFEYGATGATLNRTGQFGTSEDMLIRAGNIIHWGTNYQINTNDIISGYDAIARGGALSVIYIPIP